MFTFNLFVNSSDPDQRKFLRAIPGITIVDILSNNMDRDAMLFPTPHLVIRHSGRLVAIHDKIESRAEVSAHAKSIRRKARRR